MSLYRNRLECSAFSIIPNFNPRTPCGVRQPIILVLILWAVFQSTHPVRGATEYHGQRVVTLKISIHAPRAGCDRRSLSSRRIGLLFQSMHPVRGATGGTLTSGYAVVDFNPRTPCGVRLSVEYNLSNVGNFNPRTPCGVRRAEDNRIGPSLVFQSTHPVRGATIPAAPSQLDSIISIHAPRAGCDGDCVAVGVQGDISIHAPRAGCDGNRL